MAITYTTWNPDDKSANITLSDGNLTAETSSGGWNNVRSVLSVTTGKYYFEYTITDASLVQVGIVTSATNYTTYFGGDAYSVGWQLQGEFYIGALFTGNGKTPVSLGNGDIACIALDMDAGKIWFGKNGAWIGSGDPAAGTDWTFSFTPTNPIPGHLTTVYGTTEQVCLTTTISGAEPEYIYDAVFYDEFDVQIGTTVSGIQNGQPAESNEYLSTPSGIDYSWYMTVTSSGVEDTSSTYTFHNRFLYEGYVTENDNPISRKVNLYYRNTGELIDTTTSSGSNGYYKLSAINNDTHFIVAFDDEAGEDYNALILDKLLPVGSE
jgi:hypothetical protein